MNKFLTSLLLLAALWHVPAWTFPDALPDQNGTAVSLGDYLNGDTDSVVLAIVVSGRKLRLIKKWEEGLRESYPQLVSIRVADITDEPRPTHEQVAKKLRKRAPEGVSIMIDLQNTWADTYELETSEPCLLLFDGAGDVVAQFRGRANKERLTEVLATLQQHLEQSPEARGEDGAS